MTLGSILSEGRVRTLVLVKASRKDKDICGYCHIQYWLGMAGRGPRGTSPSRLALRIKGGVFLGQIRSVGPLLLFLYDISSPLSHAVKLGGLL